MVAVPANEQRGGAGPQKAEGRRKKTRKEGGREERRAGLTRITAPWPLGSGVILTSRSQAGRQPSERLTHSSGPGLERRESTPGRTCLHAHIWLQVRPLQVLAPAPPPPPHAAQLIQDPDGSQPQDPSLNSSILLQVNEDATG